MDLHRHLNGEIECRSLRLSGKFIWIAVIAAIRLSKADVAAIRLCVLSLYLFRITVQAFGIRFDM